MPTPRCAAVREMCLACVVVQFASASTAHADCPAGWTTAYNMISVVDFYPAGESGNCAEQGQSGGTIECPFASQECIIEVKRALPGSDPEIWEKGCDDVPAACVQNGFLYLYGVQQ